MSPSGPGERYARTTARHGTAWDSFPHDHARSRAYPMERGRSCGHLRRPTDAVPVVRVLERPRSDPEGADLRTDRPAGQPRRGCQGVLVLRGLHADAFMDAVALLLPADRVPVLARWSTRTGAAANTTPSSNCSTPASSTTTATGTSPIDYAKAGVDDIVARVQRAQRRTRHGVAARPADAVVPQHVVVGTRRSQAEHRSERRRPGRSTPHAGQHDALTETVHRGCCSATTSRTRDGCGTPTGQPSRRTASTITSSTASTRSTPTAAGTQGGAVVRARGGPGRNRASSRSACAPATLRSTRAVRNDPCRSSRRS